MEQFSLQLPYKCDAACVAEEVALKYYGIEAFGDEKL